MTRTTKSERKYGKKTESVKKRTQARPKEHKDKPEVELYKVYVDYSFFTKPMTLEKCNAYIDKKNKEAAKFGHQAPSLVIVKH